MKVLVTGVDGYIGSVLAPILTREGHTVVGLDTGFYREGWLYNDRAHFTQLPTTINKDIREITADDLDGIDAIVHLAELSNDPLGENNPDVTFAINHKGSVSLAKLAKEFMALATPISSMKIPRLILRRLMPNARSWSNATLAQWRMTTFRRLFFEMRRHLAPRRECALTSC
jgi:nucleoside-diphosphate-sugar epimerase